MACRKPERCVPVNNPDIPVLREGSPHHNETTTKAVHWIDVEWCKAFADTSVYGLAAICAVQFESRFVTEYHTAPVLIPPNTSSVIIGLFSSKAPSPIVYDHSNVLSRCARSMLSQASYHCFCTDTVVRSARGLRRGHG